MNNSTKNLSRNLTYSDIRADINESKDLHEDIFNYIEKTRAQQRESIGFNVEVGETSSYTLYNEFLKERQNMNYLISCDKELESTLLKIKPIDFDKVLKN